jgi:hypothetical protein
VVASSLRLAFGRKSRSAYEGVLLEELLRRAGAPQGEKLRGPAMATYVVAEADDGYRVVHSQDIGFLGHLDLWF